MLPRVSGRDSRNLDSGSGGRNNFGPVRNKSQIRTLNPNGYLYSEKVNTNNIIDPQDLGLTFVQARRKGRMERFHTPEKYRSQAQQIQGLTRTKQQERLGIDKEMWGDEITTNATWPKVTTNGHLRLLFYNVNGISYKNKFFEMDMLMQLGGQLQADAMLITEVNLNLHKPMVRAQIKESIRQYDKYAKVQLAYPPESPFTSSSFNMGGTMAIIQGGLSGRCQEQGSDTFGRWSWFKLQGQDYNVVIIGGYKVGKQSGSPGGTSVAQQEVRAMLRRDHPHANRPRKAFDNDLADFCIRQQNLGNEIILLMDANTPLDSAESRKFASDANLHSVAEIKFPNAPLPRTHIRGSRCIDHCLVTRRVLNWIVKFGYFPFYAHSLYDHRGMVLDICCSQLLGKVTMDETRKVTRKLRASNPREADKYRKNLKTLLHQAGIFEKVTNLSTGFKDLDTAAKLNRWKHLQKYNATTKELMIAAENQLRPKRIKTPFWSPVLQLKGRELRYYNERIKADDEWGDLGLSIPIPEGIHPDNDIHTTEDLHQKHIDIKNDWRQINNKGESLRKQYLLEKAERAHEQRNIKLEAAIKQIINAETSRALHRRHGAVMKGKHPGSLKKILVPFPDSSIPAPTSSKKCEVWREIDDDTTINNLFVHLNRKKLLMAEGSDFAPGGLLHDMVGSDGCSAGADDLLEGKYNVHDLLTAKREDIDTLLTFIKHMARPKDKDGQMVMDMEWVYGPDEYRASFSKKNEDTSCGPSGLHMSHWIAACEDDDLCLLHSQFISAAFQIGLPYDRWKISYHAMIQKKDRAWANAMRIVQLLEGDYNAGLRFLVQRSVVAHAEKHNLYSESTYGGRKGKNTQQVLGRIQATNEYCRLARTPAVMADVDAVNCFDCMTHSGIGYFQRRQGSPKDLAQTQCATLIHTKHYIKTGLGISKTFIHRTELTKPQGSGQGGGASVGNWQGHNDPMILAFQDLCHGCTLLSPDKKRKFCQWMVSFVDDNKLFMNFTPTTPEQMIYQAMNNGIKTWREILNITGGELELDKTWVGLLTFDYDTYEGKHLGPHARYRAGVPKILNSNLNNSRIQLDDDAICRELEPDQGLRLLGVRMSLSGDFSDEYEHRKGLVMAMAGKLRATAFDARDAWLIYQTRYKPMIRYCLPITTFTTRQCNEIQSPFVCAFLNKLGMNRHTPRAVVWGPYKFGGLNILNIEVAQLSAHVLLLIANIRKGTATGRCLLMAMGMYQITLGCEKPFWDLNPEWYPTQSPRVLSLQYLWDQLHKIRASLHVPGMWTPVAKVVGDSCLIDDIVNIAIARKGTSNKISTLQIALANSCRLYLQVTWLSDITTPDGHHIEAWAYFGQRQIRENNVVYPHQPLPPERAWREWRNLLLATYLEAAGVQANRGLFPLYQRLSIPHSRPSPQSTWPPCARDLTLTAIIEKMPLVWQQALGNYVLPEDDGKELAGILSNGGTVRAWSDGTVATGVGAHAYTLRTACNDTDMMIVGDALTPGAPDTISSLRAEHYGAMAIVIMILAIEWKYDLENSGYVLLHIDNMEVVNRVRHGVAENMSADKHTKTDFDIWKETDAISKQLSTVVCTKWVRGHQDKFLCAEQGGVGPMPLEAHFNILMDRRAEECRLNGASILPTIPMTSDEASLVMRGYLITTNVSEHVTRAMTDRPLVDYILRKNGWSMATFHTIDWAAFGTFMRRLSAAKRAKVVKLQHDWQNTGHQKGLFLREAGLETEGVEAELCPLGCGCIEDALHYVKCTSNPKMAEMMKGLQGIKAWMRRNDAAPGLVPVLMRILRKYIDNDHDHLEDWSFDQEVYSRRLYQLTTEQRAIGWDSLLKGRLSNQWQEIQRLHFRVLNKNDQLPLYKTAEWWTAGLIQQLIYFTLNAWQIRNDYLHRDREMKERNRERQQLQEEMTVWHTRAARLGTLFNKYVRMPILQRKTHSSKQLRSWIETVKEQYGYAIRKNVDGPSLLQYFTQASQGP